VRRPSAHYSSCTTIPLIGSSHTLLGSTSENTGGLPSWVQPLQPSQDPYSAQFAGHWAEATAAQGQLSPSGRDSSSPLASSLTLPYRSTLLSSGGIGATASPVGLEGWRRRSSAVSPKFDGRDQLCLGDGWFLIRGENGFFLELADNGLDIPTQWISQPHSAN
jgi:hypothetical protein